MTLILFIIGLFLLIKGADLLVEGASSIAKRFKVSDMAIGLTVVAFGTSMPELAVSLAASIGGNTEISIGNVLGSNIANILLILGVCACIVPITIHKETVLKELPFAMLAVAALFFLALDLWLGNGTSNLLSRGDGLVLLLFFGIFMYYTFGIAKRGDVETDSIHSLPAWKSVLFIVLGLAGLVVGGKWLVDGAVDIALFFGMSQTLVGLTVVAVGTSLPELATSLAAARKGRPEIAVGNVVGSNIFNVLWILGVSAVVAPLPYSRFNIEDTLITLGVTIVATAIILIGTRHVLTRFNGLLFLLGYVGYVVYIVIR